MLHSSILTFLGSQGGQLFATSANALAMPRRLPKLIFFPLLLCCHGAEFGRRTVATTREKFRLLSALNSLESWVVRDHYSVSILISSPEHSGERLTIHLT
jgi:hypothetical protein